MKNILIFWVFALWSINVIGQVQQTTNAPPPTPYTIVSRDANSRVWEWTTYELSPSGQTISHLHQYTELGTGLCYQQNGQWVDSQEQINILPDGSACATNGLHQAYFPSDIYNGAITLVTPDGLQLQSQPLGLFYDDSSNTVMFAELTNSVGQLISSNQIIYTNAFTGVDADLLYTYRVSGFEQDVIFREQPPAPEQFGLSSADTRLQLLTEYFNPPTPGESTGPVNLQDGLQDTTLTFGAMKMIQGRAFLTGDTTLQNNLYHIPIYKSWAVANGRTFLVEESSYPRISPQLETLPAPSSASVTPANSILDKVSSKRLLPPARLVTVTTNTVRIAKAGFEPNHGLVFDYVTVNPAATNFTFQGDTTYYVSGDFLLTGTNTLEGGSVIKLDGIGLVEIDASSSLTCDTTSYRPAIFTSYNDNSVGQTISGSSGSPNWIDCGESLQFDTNGDVTINDLRFCYTAIATWSSSSNFDLWNCQFIDVVVSVYGNNIGLYNDLFGESANEVSSITNQEVAQVYVEGPSLIAENVTADSGYAFMEADYGGASVCLTNCIVTSQPLLSSAGVTLTAITNDVAWLLSPSAPVYQTVGAGNYYLATNSPCRNAGTTNIDPSLFSELAEKTTWPPTVYSNTAITVDSSLSPIVQRDNVGAPDLGYHYDTLDYVFGGCDLYSNLTITTGTAVGFFQGYGGVNINGQPYGISLNNGANLSFNGSATQPCYFSDYCMVQEGGNGNWTKVGYEAGIVFNGSGTTPYPQLTGNFTKWTAGAQEANFFRDKPAYGAWGFFNCEFYDGNLGAFLIPTAYFTNCLFVRDFIGYWDQDYSISFSFENCTFYAGGLTASRTSGQSGDSTSFWLAENTAFDGTAFDFADNYNGSTNHTLFNYNAYNTNNLDWTNYPPLYPSVYGTLETNGSDDVLVTNYNWQTSWFGNYYLPSDSPLIEAGSTNANLLGLYHFTTQTNQLPQYNNPVDIGYHYVATDANGNPLDNGGNGSGIPDYLEDANGNGIVDSGEIGWDIAADPGLTVIITQPRNGSTLP